MRGGTKKSATQGAETKRIKYGLDFFPKIGKKGGKSKSASKKKNLHFSDKSAASKAGAAGAKARWAKYYAEQKANENK